MSERGEGQSVGKEQKAGLPSRCSPKVYVLVGGFAESHRASKDTTMPTRSVSMCRASVIMAKLLAKYPPTDKYN